MSHFEIGTYTDRQFAWPRGFKEQFPDKNNAFWKAASFIGESLSRNPNAVFDARIRAANNVTYQVELVCSNGESTVGRIDFAASEFDSTNSEECLAKMKELISEARELVDKNAKNKGSRES